MTPLPRVSIVTCSFQQGRYLAGAIQSVVDQNYSDVEHVVIDGGSTDDTLEVIKRFAPHIAYWVSESDDGQTFALAKGFKKCTGDILGWLCSDDLLLPGALEVIVDHFLRHPDCQVLYGNALLVDGEGTLVRPKKEIDFYPFIFHFDHNYLAQPAVFWRRSVYEKVGGVDLRFDLAMDTDLWSRLAEVTNIHHVDCYLACWRVYPAQKTQRLRAESLKEAALVAKRYARANGLHWLHPRIARYIARVLRVGARLLRGAYWADVDQQLLLALVRYRPTGNKSKGGTVTTTSPNTVAERE